MPARASRRMGLDPIITDLAQRCAEQVFRPEESGCLGFGGDRRMTCTDAVNTLGIN